MEIAGELNEEVLLLLGNCGCCNGDALDGLSTGSVLDLNKGVGPLEKFWGPRSWALVGWDAGKRVKLDRAGEVARR